MVRESEDSNQQYQNVLAEVRKFDQGYDPDRPIPPATIYMAKLLIPVDRPTAIVQFSLLNDDGVAVIIARSDDAIVKLPALSRRSVGQLVLSWLMNEPLTAFKQLLEPLWNAVSQYERLIFIPHAAMNLLPLHAATIDDRGTTALDRFEIAYLPSASLGYHVMQRLRGRTPGEQTLSACNPTYDLPGAAAERYIIAPRFPNGLHEQHKNGVTREWLIQKANDRHVWHYAGHAHYDGTNPLDSAFDLAVGKLTLGDILKEMHLPACWLADLGACESSFPDLRQMDEAVSLATGFLYAGASSVIATLRSVDDLATLLLKVHFYRHWKPGEGVAAALKAAQIWLRDLSGEAAKAELEPLLDKMAKDESIRAMTKELQAKADRQLIGGSKPFASIYKWAPFTANGLAWPLAQGSTP